MRLSRVVGALLSLLLAAPALALEPVTVEVEGVAQVDGEGAAARDRAFEDAMVEAVFEVSRQLLPPEALAGDPGELRARLRPRASDFVLTYRIVGPLRRRVSPQDGLTAELSLPVSATVDAGQLRSHLRDLGLLAPEQGLPSLALRVRDADPLASPAPALISLERFLADRFRAQGLVVVEPALRPPGSGEAATTLELARQLGADVALDVSVAWRARDTGSRVRGGVADVHARAVRAGDAAEIAVARFEGAGYHERAEEAFGRALDAVREQVAENVLLQLGQNWQALSREGGPVELWLFDVSSLLQVDAVRDALRATLGARRADLIELSPRAAALQVEGPLSPGALQDRLAAMAFDDFRLEPLGVSGGRVELRVALPAAPDEPAGPPGGR